MNFISSDLKEFRKNKGLLIDVRSPDEYYKGHMPNSKNIPIFNNEERSIIGKKYKIAGREIAVREGFKIMENKIDKLIKEIIFIKDELNISTVGKLPDHKNIKIYCARGGMRSQSMLWLLEKFKYNCVTLKGGYKTYRNWVLNSFENKKKIIVIGGKTGTRKTKILNKLKSLDYQILDFESLANHRGSSFGGLGMIDQPTNEQYENLISEDLVKFNKNKFIFVEAESPNIGKNRIPHKLYSQIKNSKRIEIIRDESIRIEELINTYSRYQKKDLKESVLRISKRLGPQRTKSAIDAIDNEEWENVCKSVLDYYDKCYEYELKDKKDVKILHMDLKSDNEIINEILKTILI